MLCQQHNIFANSKAPRSTTLAPNPNQPLPALIRDRQSLILDSDLRMLRAHLLDLQISMRGGSVYIVKPKYIFKHPFNKYDLANPTNRETQNQELTDYFNYGFNEDTMNTYGKLVKRFIEVLDHHKNLEYFNEPSELMRLNDEMPMDFGGFCKFHDPSIVDNDTPENFHTGEPLVRYFIMMIFANASRKIEYPLIEFVKHMYKKEGEEEGQDTALYDIIEQIGKNLEQKYQETMKKLIDKQNEAKNPPQKKGKDDRRDFQRDRDGDRSNPKDRDRQRQRQREKEREKEREREREKQREAKKAAEEKQIKKQKERKSKSESQSSSDSDSESQKSNQSTSKKKKREGKDRSEERSKKHKRKEDKDRKKKEKKEKHKTKKVKKEKSHKRSKSRDRKKKHN